MPGLQILIEETSGSDVWVDAACRFDNVTGTPVDSAESNDDGELISDTYALVFDLVNEGVNARVKVTCGSPNNPNGNQVGLTVLLDSATEYKNIIRGVTLIFSDGTFADGDAAEIRCGYSFGTRAGFGEDAGVASTSRRLKVTNTGDAPGSDCTASLDTMAQLWAKVGSVFALVKPFATDAVEKLDGDSVAPYAVTVDNVTGVGSSKVYDVLFDGSPVEIINADESITQMSEAVNVTDVWTVTSGDLEDLTFQLSEDCVDGDTANILIFSTRFVQIAADIDGAPDTFGTSDVDLTEEGQSTGTITDGGDAFFHIRVLVPNAGNSSSNPYISNIKLTGAASDEAGWTD